MIEIVIDGRKVKTEAGTPVLEAALRAGIAVPHFCYHKKLSVTASCRMCLVEVEKSPRLLPACATPASDGMSVHTATEKAADARRAVMEFLLINHPLDCPVCDQGGECRLQDYAVEYGAGKSRYQEEKRMVFSRNVSPLISMQEMNRCILCTRCVRFGIEIGGKEELGVANRGGRSEISVFPGTQIESELSGNMIDICPVGALTSKLFRFQARGWELSGHFSVSPHDGLGSNLNVQTLDGKVMRVLPHENEDVNECWLSDRDRFSYEALNSPERLTVPMVKQGGRWIETDWQTALSYVVHGLKSIRGDHGPSSIAALASPQSTLEETFLLQKLVRALGSEKIECRLRQRDFSLDGKTLPWLGMPVSGTGSLDYALFIGVSLRQDAPLLASRFRRAANSGMKAAMIHAADEDWLMPVSGRVIISPDRWLSVLGEIILSLAEKKGILVPAGISPAAVSKEAESIAASLAAGGKKALFLGRLAFQHENYSLIHRAAEWIAGASGAVLGCLTDGANTAGAMISGAVPDPRSGVTLADIASDSTKAFLLLHTEPELDSGDPLKMLAALKQAEMVVAMSAFKQSMDYADVLLPVSPFTETSGSYISFEGRLQSFAAAVPPAGDARPAWKVLRVLGNFLDLEGFDFSSSEEIRDAALAGRDIAGLLGNLSGEPPAAAPAGDGGLARIAGVPLYSSDSIVRRAASLQKTKAAEAPAVRLPAALFDSMGIAENETVRIIQDGNALELPARRDARLADGVISLAAGFGPVSGKVRVERL